MEYEDDGFDREHWEQSPAVGNPTIRPARGNVAGPRTITSGLEQEQTPPGLLHPHVGSIDHSGCYPSFGEPMVRTGPVPPSPPVGWLPRIVVYRPPLSEIRPYPGVPPLSPIARPRLPSGACRAPLSETSLGPRGVPYVPFSSIDMEAGLIGVGAADHVNPEFIRRDIPLHGFDGRHRVDAWRHDTAFVGGSHERGGSSNASILRERSESVAAAQRRRHDDQDDGEQELLAERRESNRVGWYRRRHHDNRREMDRYGRHDHDRHMSSTTSYRSEERDDRYSYDHDHDRELGRDRYVPYPSGNYRLYKRDQRYAYARRDRCRAELRRDGYVPRLSRERKNRGGTYRGGRDDHGHASRDRRRRDRHTEVGRDRPYVTYRSRRIRDSYRDERDHGYDHGRDRNR